MALILIPLSLFECSGHQCSVHADIHWGSFLPIHMLKAIGSWCVASGIRFSWLCSNQVEGEAILDHQEFMGWELGRERILQNLQGSQHLWSWFLGFDRSCCCPWLTLSKESSRYWSIGCFVYKAWDFSVETISSIHRNDISYCMWVYQTEISHLCDLSETSLL